MKCSLGISNFLEKFSSLSYSIAFLYFFALITKEGFLISPCYSLDPVFRCIYLSFSPLLFTSFHSYLWGLLRQPFGFLYFFFLGMVLISVSCTMSGTSFHSSSGILYVRSLGIREVQTKTEMKFIPTAATARSLQSCPTLCDPIDGSPSGSPSLGFSRQEHWSRLPFPSPMHESEKWKWSHSVMSDPQRPHRLQPSRLLRPWDFPGKSTGVGCHCLLWSYPLELV